MTYWIWGIHAVQAALKNPRRRWTKFLVTKDNAHPKAQVVDRQTLGSCLPEGAVHQGMALLVEPLPEGDLRDLYNLEEGLVLALDQVTDPHNVGAIIRSAAAFGVKALLMTERHAPTLQGVLAKSASGALEHVPLITVKNLVRTLEDLKKNGFWCIGLDERGAAPLHRMDLPPKRILILGAEGEGLRRLTREACDYLAQLPTQPAFPTLNVSVAAALGIYELVGRS